MWHFQFKVIINFLYLSFVAKKNIYHEKLEYLVNTLTGFTNLKYLDI